MLAVADQADDLMLTGHSNRGSRYIKVDVVGFHRTTKGHLQTLAWAALENVVETMGCKFCTKIAESGALETNGLRETRSALWQQSAVGNFVGKACRYWPFRGRPKPERLFA